MLQISFAFFPSLAFLSCRFYQRYPISAFFLVLYLANNCRKGLQLYILANGAMLAAQAILFRVPAFRVRYGLPAITKNVAGTKNAAPNPSFPDTWKAIKEHMRKELEKKEAEAAQKARAQRRRERLR